MCTVALQKMNGMQKPVTTGALSPQVKSRDLRLSWPGVPLGRGSWQAALLQSLLMEGSRGCTL